MHPHVILNVDGRNLRVRDGIIWWPVAALATLTSAGFAYFGLWPTMLSPELQPVMSLVAAGAALGAVAAFLAAIPFIIGGQVNAARA